MSRFFVFATVVYSFIKQTIYPKTLLFPELKSTEVFMLGHTGEKISISPSRASRFLKEMSWSETEFCSLSEHTASLAL